ncbi:fibronectin type III domain-containing protein [Viridibacillus arvi]|uniref:fibronectin type III domain-containing protein n=1 Tax=Viridibacillus arvi TaxID=263475 RepID=UPI0034CF0D28
MKKQISSKGKNTKSKIITGAILAPMVMGIVATSVPYDEVFADTEFIEIHTAAELQSIKDNPKGSYRLVNEIDLTGVNWTPFDFQGVLDANGFKIKNLKLDNVSGYFQGLFSSIKGNGSVKNLTIENFNITSKGSTVGALAGTIDNAMIENVKVVNSTVKGIENVGLLTGKSTRSTVKHVMTEGTVSGAAYIGGLVGYTSDTNKIENVYTNAIVNGSTSYSSGVIAYNEGPLMIENVYTTSKVKGANFVGGVLGRHASSSSAITFTNVYALNALVEGTGTDIGNLIGKSERQITSSTAAREDIKGNGSNRYLKQVISETYVEKGLVGFEDNSVWKQDPTTKLPIFVEQEAFIGEVPTYESKATVLSDEQGTFKAIYKIEDLKNIVHNNLDGLDRYKLMNDIDFEGITWTPFQLSSQLDGNGFKIKNLKLDNATGLFSSIKNGSVKNLIIENFNIVSKGTNIGLLAGFTENATIENVKVINSKLLGVDNVGLLTGRATRTTMNHIMSEGTVKGDYKVGGLIGYAYDSNTLENVYTNAVVEASTSYSGGVIGYNEANLNLKNVYTTAAVKGANFVGGVLGRHAGSSTPLIFTNVYALNALVEGTGTDIGNFIGQSDREITSKIISHEAIKGNSGSQYVSQVVSQTDIENGLVGFENSSIWKQDTVTKLPIFVEQSGFTGELPKYEEQPNILIQDGTTYSIIRAAEDIQNVTHAAKANRIFANDIELSGVAFKPINNFSGILEGNNFSIRNMNITSQASQSSVNVGLFSILTGEIKNLHIEDANIDTENKNNVGILAGVSDGANIHNVFVSGKVKGSGHIGGLVGTANRSTKIDQVYAQVNVSGSTDIGGLVGTMSEGKVSNSYASGIVSSSNSNAGGLVGYNSLGTIEKSYASNKVDGLTMVGGLVGNNQRSGISNSIALNPYVKGTGPSVGKAVGYSSIPNVSTNVYVRENMSGSSISHENYYTSTISDEEDRKKITYASLASFDMENIWGITEGESLPYLKTLGSNAWDDGNRSFAPAAPILSKKSASFTSLSFQWNKVNSADYYIVKRNGVEIGRVTETSYTDTSLTKNTLYKYEVIAVNEFGESSSAQLSMQTLNIPTAEEFKVTKRGYNDLTLNWQGKNNEIVEGFKIARDGKEIAQVPFDADTENYVYKDTNLTNGTSYDYEITAMFDGDLSEPTQLTESTLSVGKPTTVELKKATENSLSFTWEPVDIATEYIILRNDVEIARVTEPTFMNEGLKPSTSYNYKVITVSPYGNSQPSDITAKTSDKIDIPNPKFDTAIKEKEVVVSWDNFEEFYQKDISHYRVIVEKKNETGEFAQEGTPMELNGKSHTFSSLDPNTEYRITIIPQIDGDYNEEHAVSKVIKTLKEEEDKPTVLNVTATTSNKDVIVKWDTFEYKGVPSTRYRVQRYIKLEDGTFVKDGFARATTTNELTVTGLSKGNEYYFEVTPQVSNTYKDEFNGISNKITFEVPPVEVVEPITNVIASLNENTVEITWDEFMIKGNTSTRYRVQVYEKDTATGDLVKKGAAVTVSENSYAYNKLEDGKTYLFMITPQANGTYNEAYSTVSNEIKFEVSHVEVPPSEVDGPKVMNVVASLNGKTVDITWDEFKIKGNTSTRYRVQAYEKDMVTGELVRKGTTVAVNGNSYSYSNLEKGKTYLFMITPQANGTYNESYSNFSNEIRFEVPPVEVTEPKVSNVVASLNEKTAEITWDEFIIKGNASTRYHVQAYEKDTTTGELVKKGAAVTVSGNSYTYNKLEDGKTYLFMVTPQANGTYNEKYSTVSNEFTYEVRATVKGTTVMLDWNEVADVTRYKVEKYKYNAKQNKYELDGYGVSTDKNTHSFSDLEKNTKYKFVIIPRVGYVYDSSSQIITTAIVS